MTTTPAPTDLDFDPACSCRRCGRCDRALGELAKLRTYLAVEEQSHGETIDDRDACHEAADKLAGAIAAAAGVDIGEHSNMNDPWANALDAMPKLVAELATYKAEVKHADAEREEAERNRNAAREELAALKATCTCATTYATYEGPEADCAVHGAVRAFNEAVRERDAVCAELTKTRAELDRLHAQVSRVSAFCQGVLSEAIAPTEYQAVMAQEVLSRLANPATTAEPADEHCCGCDTEYDMHCTCDCHDVRPVSPEVRAEVLATLPLLPDIAHMTTPLPDDDAPPMAVGIIPNCARCDAPMFVGHRCPAEPADEPKDELCSDKNGFHDGHDWTPDPCEPYRWCPGYPVPTCGHKHVSNEGEFTCDLYNPHPGKHWNSLAEFAWTAEPAAS